LADHLARPAAQAPRSQRSAPVPVRYLRARRGAPVQAHRPPAHHGDAPHRPLHRRSREGAVRVGAHRNPRAPSGRDDVSLATVRAGPRRVASPVVKPRGPDGSGTASTRTGPQPMGVDPGGKGLRCHAAGRDRESARMVDRGRSAGDVAPFCPVGPGPARRSARRPERRAARCLRD
jgi:hypothetical protein